MILSMTGYGTGAGRGEETEIAVEIRTVNHRFLDVHTRLPREYTYLEAEVQQVVRGTLGRGRVDVSVSLQCTNPATFLVNAESARSYIQAASRLRDEFRLEDSIDLKTLLTLPGVLQNRDNVAAQAENNALKELLAQTVRQALEGVLRMREQEGRALETDMRHYLTGIGEKAKCIHRLAPATTVEYRRKLEERLAQLLPQNGVDPQRLAQEVALFAERCDITEEITRLESHVEQYMSLMDNGREVGKKLDFLLQEMQREINTILSKSANLEITGHGITIKADIEKLREQVQNVE
ncbi:MAG TPA: YicC/YloC family endoribonuclease [Acidobacteriota bacterium]|nr:YicC/YloC family endoribonuclease [Acidobacteriota bacterium]